ncbi:MAG: TetR/AcrR family transcriptional regulator [Vulcanimicrobiaceae bacterium]
MVAFVEANVHDSDIAGCIWRTDGIGRTVMRSDGRASKGDAEQRPTTSERLVETAAKLFWSKGYASTTTREIAALLGVRKASLYHHVKSKEDVLYEICVSSLDHITQSVQAALTTTDDPLERVRTLIRAHVTSMVVDQDKHSTMLTELRALSPQRRAEIVRRRDTYEALVRTVLVGGQECGALRRDVPVRYLGFALLNLMNWSIFWFDRSGDLSPDALAEMLATMFLTGSSGASALPDQP